MINKENIQKINEILEKYGEDIQMVVATEELSELIQSISKLKRKIFKKEVFKENIDFTYEICNIKKEICDVYVMLEQLKIIFNLKEDELNEIITFKLNKVKL